MFTGWWHVVRKLEQPLHKSLDGFGVSEYPYTVSFVIKRRIQIDSYMELPEDKRPPRSIWDKPSKISEWFDRVYGDNIQTEFVIPTDESSIE